MMFARRLRRAVFGLAAVAAAASFNAAASVDAFAQSAAARGASNPNAIFEGDLRRYAGPQTDLRENGGSYAPVSQIEDDRLVALSSGVVLLRRRQVNRCFVDQRLSTAQRALANEPLVEADRDCTAWRVGPTWFATAAHCMTGAQICASSSVRFGTGERAGCARIVYLNRRLDFAIFETAVAPDARWPETAAILNVVAGTGSWPYRRTSEAPRRFRGDRLSVLQFPSGRAVDEVHAQPLTDVGQCRALTIAGLETEDEQTVAPLAWRADVREPCDVYRLVSDRTDLGARFPPSFHHNCSTQPSSSGSPIISLTEPRAYTVVGVHISGAPAYLNRNTGIRMSRIADCIDLPASIETGEIVASPQAGTYADCRAVTPGGLPHRRCVGSSSEYCFGYTDPAGQTE